MKNKNFYLLFSGLFLLLILGSCSKTTETQSEKFFKYFNNQNYDQIESLCNAAKREFVSEMSKKYYSEFRELSEYEKYDLTEHNIDDQKHTNLFYNCRTEKDNNELFCKLDFIPERGDGDPLLVSVIMSFDKTFIDNYDENAENAKSVANDFYDRLEKGDLDGVFELFDNSLSEEDKYNEFFGKIGDRIEKFGTAENSYYESFLGEFQDGQTVFHVIYYLTSEKNTFYEKISLIKKGSDFKIFDYNYAKNIEDL